MTVSLYVCFFSKKKKKKTPPPKKKNEKKKKKNNKNHSKTGTSHYNFFFEMIICKKIYPHFPMFSNFMSTANSLLRKLTNSPGIKISSYEKTMSFDQIRT